MTETPDIVEEHEPLNAIQPSMAQAVGYVTMYWSAIDMQLYAFLSKLTDDKSVLIDVLVAELSVTSKLDAITSILHASRRRSWYDEWCEIEKRIDVIRNKRNDVVHGLWGAGKDKNHYLMRIKARRRLTVTQGAVSLSEVVSLYEAIAECYNILGKFADTVFTGGLVNAINNPTGAPLSHGPSPAQTAQDQAREQKRQRKAKNRERSLAAQTTKAQSGDPGDPTEI